MRWVHLVAGVVLLAAVAVPAQGGQLGVDVSCVKYNKADCELHKLEGCVPCLAFGRVEMCFTEAQAAKLSPRFFQCEAVPTPPDAVLLTAAAHNGGCEGMDEASCSAAPACVWCLSAAVPSACYAEEDAKRLPAAVFQCKFKSATA